tara:strand:+ start:4173 stop:5891 length:1719 start_codon:yes stop_codon:yes gene_type:complete
MSLDSEIDSRKLALSGLNSQQLADRLRRSGGLLDALATQKLLSEKEAYKRDLAMQMEQSPKTIAQKNEELLKQQSQMDVAQGVAGVLQNRKRRSDANAKMLAGIDPRKLKAMTKRPMGLPNAPVPRVQKAAQGGIVGFQEGMSVNLLPMVADSGETFVDALGKDEASMEVINQVVDYVRENPAEATILAGSTAFLGPTGAAVSTTAKGLAATLGKSFKPLLNTILRGVTKPKKLPSGRLSSVKRSPSLTQAVTKGLPAAAVAGVAAKEFGPPILEGIQSLGSKAGLPFFPKEPEMGQVDASSAVAPTVEPESVRDAQRMMDINEIPVAPDIVTTTGPKDPTELFAQIDPKGERTKEKKTKIPKVNGDESPNELNQKEEVINSNLDELAIRLSKFARSDPRKPGGYTAASFQRDQEILAEKQKAQALRMKQRELDIRAELNNIRRDQLTQNYFTTRLASLDKSIIDAMELFRDSPLYMNATNKIAILTQKLEEEQNKSGIFGFGGPDEEKIQDIKDDIKEQRDILKIGEAELTGGFIAEREALSNKYTELYTNYTGDDKKEDFNLKDQRTVGQ